MKLLLGVTGGIAAYKACELTSLAVKAGHSVRVVMTTNATRFVGPLTFEALSGHPVFLDTFTGAMDHIAWAKWADVAMVAPCTASTLGRIACGLADDALTTVLLALPARVPVVIAPAMNTEMWNHPLVRRNLGWLADAGRYRFVDPVTKRLACGDVGPGGLADPVDLLAVLEELAALKDLAQTSAPSPNG